METSGTAPRDIDEYIAGFPEDIRQILERVRATIKKAAPDAVETISYKVPTFNLNGRYLIYFAAYKKHIGVYPTPAGEMEFKEEMSAYESGKGTLKFPLDKPIPFELITKVVKFRAKGNLQRAEARKVKR